MFTLNEIATTSRVDRNGRLKLAAAVSMMQDCSELWLDSVPEVQRYFAEQHYAQLLASRQVEVVRVPRFGEQLTVTTSVYECQGSFGYRNTFIRDARGADCYRSWSMGAFVCRDTGRLVRIPDHVASACRLDPKLEMTYLDRRIRMPQAEPELACTYRVCRNDIDYNGHMNNAHYIRLAVETLPENYRPVSLRVEHKLPLREAEEAEIRTLAVDDTCYVTIASARGTAAIIEFRG